MASFTFKQAIFNQQPLSEQYWVGDYLKHNAEVRESDQTKSDRPN
jgi:hypothetical protein